MRDLLEAVDLGKIPLAFLEEEVRRGHVRPSLVPQVKERIDEGLLLPQAIRDLDREFDAPSRSPRSAHPKSFGRLRAAARSAYHRSPLPRWVGGLLRRLSQRK